MPLQPATCEALGQQPDFKYCQQVFSLLTQCHAEWEASKRLIGVCQQVQDLISKLPKPDSNAKTELQSQLISVEAAAELLESQGIWGKAQLTATFVPLVKEKIATTKQSIKQIEDDEASEMNMYRRYIAVTSRTRELESRLGKRVEIWQGKMKELVEQEEQSLRRRFFDVAAGAVGSTKRRKIE